MFMNFSKQIVVGSSIRVIGLALWLVNSEYLDKMAQESRFTHLHWARDLDFDDPVSHSHHMLRNQNFNTKIRHDGCTSLTHQFE